jgi:hypothetical protein
MTEEHLNALLTAADAKKGSDGWAKTPEGRLITLYIASGGAGLTVGRIEAMKIQGALLHARSVKGETFVLSLETVYAGTVDGPPASGRKAGFV